MEEFFELQDLYLDQLQSDRIRTRFLNRVDIQIWEPFFEDDKSIEFLLNRNGLSNLELSQNWINRQLNRYQDGTFGLQAIIDKKTKFVVAHCGLLIQKLNNKVEVEIGYHVLPKFRKQNYASESVKLFIDFAFESGITSSLICMIDPNNEASIKVAEKCGFKFEQFVESPNYEMGEKMNIYRLNR